MRDEAPFQHDDLAELDERLLSRARAVVAVRDFAAGCNDRDVVVMRHDVDNASLALDAAVALAGWEAEHGYRSTYYLLHTAQYWLDGRFEQAALDIAAAGHEVGIHTNAIAESFRIGVHPDVILQTAIDQLRDLGIQVTGTAAHGDPACAAEGFTNHDHFLDCHPRGESFSLNKVTVTPSPLSDFGLKYEAANLMLHHRGHYNSDSRGKWQVPFEETYARMDRVLAGGSEWHLQGPTMLLMHPDWWPAAFALEQEAVAA